MGDSMKRAAVFVAMLSIAVWAEAQNTGQPAQQTPPAAGQAAPAPGATPPVGKRPPQAKTDPELAAWKTAAANTDPAALEKAADDFATKFPDSELRVLLYQSAMRLYQNANNAEKTEAMARKVLSLDPDNPEALALVAEIIANRTRDTDIDKDQRFAEGTSMAQKAIQTVDTDISVPAGTPQEKIDAYKSLLRSNAYSTLGIIEFKKDNFPGAADYFQKSIDVYPSDPDPWVVLRLALTLDKEAKYPEALKVANHAVELAKDNTAILTPAKREVERLQQLTGAPVAAQPQTPPKN
jgi:tetratricopeptide (TPR) repeat protein